GERPLLLGRRANPDALAFHLARPVVDRPGEGHRDLAVRFEVGAQARGGDLRRVNGYVHAVGVDGRSQGPGTLRPQVIVARAKVNPQPFLEKAGQLRVDHGQRASIAPPRTPTYTAASKVLASR